MNKQKPIQLPGDDWLIGRIWDLPLDVYGLRFVVGDQAGLATVSEMEKFMGSPIAKPMPSRLRSEVKKWIADSRK
jgi:hypothetical protein